MSADSDRHPGWLVLGLIVACQASPVAAQRAVRPLWPGATAEQQQFMERVFARQRARAGKVSLPAAPAARLVVVEHGFVLERGAAWAARALLQAARSARPPQQLEVISAYRSPDRQFRNWQQNFPRYYQQTARSRAQLPGGVHSDAAVDALARYIGRRLAPPGLSLHNTGLAIDFGISGGSDPLGVGTDAANLRAWRGSALFAWLKDNAPSYDFYQNAQIDEPWHWEYRPPRSQGG